MRKSRKLYGLQKDVFGDLAWDQNQLVDLIGEYARNGFREKPEFSGRRDELLPYRDNDNSKRIYEYIANAQIPDKLKRRLKEKNFNVRIQKEQYEQGV